MKAVFLAAVVAATSCHAAEEGDARTVAGPQMQEPVVSIGDAPKDMSAFVSSDCGESGLEDCTAQDAQGRHYVFFDGALSRISIKRNDVQPGATLPAGMRFGEDIETSKKKVSSFYRVRFDRGEVDGRVAYSSDISIRSPAGVKYGLELLADEQNKLEEVVLRTDF